MWQEGESNIKDASLKDIALAELVSYIFETQKKSTFILEGSSTVS
jgi:hypothetical protein